MRRLSRTRIYDQASDGVKFDTGHETQLDERIHRRLKQCEYEELSRVYDRMQEVGASCELPIREDVVPKAAPEREQALSKSKSPYDVEIVQAAEKIFPQGIPKNYGEKRIKERLMGTLRSLKEGLPKDGPNPKTFGRALKNYPRI